MFGYTKILKRCLHVILVVRLSLETFWSNEMEKQEHLGFPLCLKCFLSTVERKAGLTF